MWLWARHLQEAHSGKAVGAENSSSTIVYATNTWAQSLAPGWDTRLSMARAILAPSDGRGLDGVRVIGNGRTHKAQVNHGKAEFEAYPENWCGRSSRQSSRRALFNIVKHPL
mgnify:CR=1 FL=1